MKGKRLKTSMLGIISAMIGKSTMCSPTYATRPEDEIIAHLNFLEDLIGEAVDSCPMIFTANTPQQENALLNKIDAVIDILDLIFVSENFGETV